MEPRTRNLILRVLVLPVIPVAALVAMELLWGGTVAVLVSKPDWEDYLSLAGGLTLVAVCAAAVKYVCNLRIRYWIIFSLVLVAIVAVMLRLVGGIFLG